MNKITHYGLYNILYIGDLEDEKLEKLAKIICLSYEAEGILIGNSFFFLSPLNKEVVFDSRFRVLSESNHLEPNIMSKIDDTEIFNLVIMMHDKVESVKLFSYPKKAKTYEDIASSWLPKIKNYNGFAIKEIDLDKIIVYDNISSSEITQFIFKKEYPDKSKIICDQNKEKSLDQLLDIINDVGIESLTPNELKTLEKYSKNGKK